MIIYSTDILTPEQKDAVIRIWNNEYPLSLQHATAERFDEYLDKLSGLQHYLLLEADVVHGWALSFDREGERWFALIIDSDLHGKGYGRLMLDELKKNEPVLNGWVIDSADSMKANGQLYRSPMEFYLKNGFTVLPDIRLQTEVMKAVKICWKQEW